MSERRKYDSTVARIAGNILSGNWPQSILTNEDAVEWAVQMARAIVAEVERTEGATDSAQPFASAIKGDA